MKAKRGLLFSAEDIVTLTCPVCGEDLLLDLEDIGDETGVKCCGKHYKLKAKPESFYLAVEELEAHHVDEDHALEDDSDEDDSDEDDSDKDDDPTDPCTGCPDRNSCNLVGNDNPGDDDDY